MMDFEKIDYDLIEKTLLHIVERYPSEGSILVFLPGMQEIMTAFDQVTILMKESQHKLVIKQYVLRHAQVSEKNIPKYM